jgi:hypothetical protein
MKRRLVKGLTAALVSASLLVGPAIAGVGSTASARAICVIRHGHCIHH